MREDVERQGSSAKRRAARATALPLDAVLRVALGVGVDDRVVLRGRTARTMLLERGRPDEAPLAAGGELALSVDVRAFPLPEVFGWLHGARKTGALLFTDDDCAKTVWLHRGEVVFAASNQRIDRLGHSLVRAGMLTLDQLRDAERGYRRGERFGKALVERGLLTPRELWTGLQRQVEEIVRSLFSHRAGDAHFFDGDGQPDNVVRLELPTERLVAEGMRWRDELARFVAALTDPRVRIDAVPARGEATSGPERRILDALAGESPFPALCRRVGLDEPTVARTLQLLHRAGAVRIRRNAEDAELTQRVRRPTSDEAASDTIQELARRARDLVAPIVEVEGATTLRARLAGVLEGLVERDPTLLGRLSLDEDARVAADAWIEAARREPPIALDRVARALAGLVEYLEFEVKNHPGVANADAVLTASSAARASVPS
jgi:DNA-binding MarR family transcriptional regulator